MPYYCVYFSMSRKDIEPYIEEVEREKKKKKHNGIMSFSLMITEIP